MPAVAQNSIKLQAVLKCKYQRKVRFMIEEAATQHAGLCDGGIKVLEVGFYTINIVTVAI